MSGSFDEGVGVGSAGLRSGKQPRRDSEGVQIRRELLECGSDSYAPLCSLLAGVSPLPSFGSAKKVHAQLSPA